MKIVIDYKEGLKIIRKYYEKNGYNVDHVTLSLDSMSAVRNIEFKIKINDKIER